MATVGRKRTIFRSVALVLACAFPVGALGASGVPLYQQDFSAFRNKTLEQKVQELADREEIRELVATYAHRATDGISMADLFTDDGTFIVRMQNRPVQTSRGRKELDATFAQIAGTARRPQPMIHNQMIAISGDEATGLSTNEVVGSVGYYKDRFRRVNGHWKFVERDFTFLPPPPANN